MTPLVLITSDEEIGSPESCRHVERLARVTERVYVLEPALGPDGKIKTARKGTGEMVLRVHPTDTAAEGNVVPELSQLVQRLYDLDDPECGVTINVDTIDGTQVDDETGTSYGQMGVGRARADPRSSRDGPLCHSEPWGPNAGRNREGAGRHQTTAAGAHRAQSSPLAERPGSGRAARARPGGRAGGGSDGNVTSRHTPTLDGLGAVGDGAHAVHEHIRIDETLERCDLLALLVLEPPLAEQGSS